MNEVEDTHCEIRRTVDLQLSSTDNLNRSFDEESKSQLSSSGYSLLSNTLGGFFEDGAYAWLASNTRLTVFSTRTGASVSSWTFRYRVTCITEFPSLPGQIPLLLVGLDNDATRLRDSIGMICVFDITRSQILRAIRLPAGVEQLCIISGGADWEESEKRVDNILLESNGLACIVLRNFDHIMIDLKRNSWENFTNFSIYDESNPAEIDISEPGSTMRPRNNREKHAVHNLMSSRIEKYLGFNRNEYESSPLSQDNLTTAMICSRKIGCLISGSLGRVIVWQNDGVVRWISPPLDDNISVTNLALLEPTDDPRPFCYLWIAYQEETLMVPPILRMYAMLFERKYSYKGTNQYFNLEGEPSMKFELELDEGTRITNLHPIIRDSNQEQTENTNRCGEESLLLISTEGKTFLFDLNQWYKEQMPRTIAECQNIDAILACYQTKPDIQNGIITCTYVPSTLKEFSSVGQGSPEEFFFPNSLSLEWAELGVSRIITWMTRGVQTQLLREMSIAGPVIMINPGETFHRCTGLGLIPISDALYNSEVDCQREMLLTLCLEQRWTTFLLRCVKDWSDGSAAYLFPGFIRWAVQRASTIKLTAHRLCIPLFDQSGSSIGEAEVKTLRSFSQQMECLSNVVENLSVETMDLNQQRRTLKRITIYLQVLLWFYDVGLLPEVQEVDDELPLSIVLRIPYPVDRLTGMYQEKRRKRNQRDCVDPEDKERDLFIDELIIRECAPLLSQWECEGEANLDGHYPPPSLQSLLRSCLIDCHLDEANELENKHQIIIYLLMDLVMLLQGSCPSVDQLVKYTAAFNISPSLTKLTQAFWLLDHEDYHGFLEIMTGPLVCDSDVKDWHHRLVIRTLIKNEQNKLALMYLRVRKPPLSSIEEQATVISLSVEHGLVQSAFHRRPPSHYTQLLTRFFKACKVNGRLNDILHLAMDTEEEEAFIQFLEAEKCEETRLLYYLQRARYNEVASMNSLIQNQAGSSSVAVFNAYNVTLPEVTRKFATNLARRNMQIDTDSRYPRPLSHIKSRSRIQQLHEAVVKKARETFTRGDRLHTPFITAPSVSLRANMNNADANCVMFLQRAQKPYGKRTRDQMREEDEAGNNSGPRKRRRTDEDEQRAADSDKKQLSLSAIFDTPLVQRKTQLINSRNPIETPHSILKIRRMMQDSITSSASPNLSPNPEEIEKRPRQIRFSINQLKCDSSLDESIQEADTVSIEASREQSTESESAYHSPANQDVIEQSTVLSDDSHITLQISGPRPRPSLRKNLNDSSDLLRKSLIHNSMLNKDSSLESSNFSLDNSISSDIISSTLRTPKKINWKDTSICASAVLSSGTSYEFSHEGSPSNTKNNGTAAVNRTRRLLESSKNEAIQLEETTTSITISKRTLHEEFEEDTEIVDVNDNTECESNFEKSYHSMEVPEKIDEESRDIIFSLKVADDPADSNHEECEREKNSADPYAADSQDEETETANPSDDYDDELMDLKYDDDEEENDEVFRSLSNSINMQNTPEPQESEVLSQPKEESPKKTAVSRFYEDFNITDDESSRSVDENMLMVKKSSPVTKNVRAESINITDDESDPEDIESMECDSKVNESPLKEVDSAIITEESRTPPMQIEVPEETLTPRRMTRGRRASSVMPKHESPETPVVRRTPRTRRASSLVPEVLSPATTPVAESRGTRSSLMKEVLTSLVTDQVPDVPGLLGRRITRRASSVQKEVEVTIPEATESSDAVTKRTRGKRATSVVKEVTTPRKTRGSVRESQMEEQLQEAKLRRTREGSVTKEVTEEMEAVPRTRAASISNESEKSVKMTKVRRGRKDSSSEPLEDLPVRRMTRAASAAKESEEHGTKNVRAKRTRTLSIESAEESDRGVRRTRGSSVTKEEPPLAEKKLTRRTRANSVTKEVSEESLPRRTRADSVGKESADESLQSRTRSGSVRKETNDGETSVRRTRAGSVPKELPNESLRTRRASSIVKEIIPEESDEVLFEKRGQGNSSQSNEEITERNARRIAPIQAIPEENEEESTVMEEVKKRKGGRQRRAMSVDLPQVETKRQTRRKNVVNDDDEIEKKSANEKKVPGRRKRAASETKEVEDRGIFEKSRRGRKVSQSNEDRDVYQFAAPEETRDPPTGELPDEVLNFIFSPPVMRSSSNSASQDRSHIVNFVPPLTDEEIKMLAEKRRTNKASDSKQVSKKSYVPGYRTEFVLTKPSKTTSK